MQPALDRQKTDPAWNEAFTPPNITFILQAVSLLPLLPEAYLLFYMLPPV